MSTYTSSFYLCVSNILHNCSVHSVFSFAKDDQKYCCSVCHQQSILARTWANTALLEWHWSLALVQCELPESWIWHSYTLHCTSSIEIINKECHLIILRQERTGQNETEWNQDVYFSSDLNRNGCFYLNQLNTYKLRMAVL